MPEIARFYGVIITMYYGDPARHPLPHFHARYGEYEASFSIDPLLLAWAEIHGDELTANWQRLKVDDPV